MWGQFKEMTTTDKRKMFWFLFLLCSFGVFVYVLETFAQVKTVQDFTEGTYIHEKSLVGGVFYEKSTYEIDTLNVSLSNPQRSISIVNRNKERADADLVLSLEANGIK